MYHVHLQPCVDAAVQAFENVQTSPHFPCRDPLEEPPTDLAASIPLSSPVSASTSSQGVDTATPDPAHTTTRPAYTTTPPAHTTTPLPNVPSLSPVSTSHVPPALAAVHPQPGDTTSRPARKRKRDGLDEEIRADLLSQLEQARLPLPSDYHVKIREHDAMRKPVEYERTLRQGYATEALDSLRMHLTTHATLRVRHQQASGVKENTKWDRRIAAKREAINQAKERYRKLRRILLLLGMGEADPSFKPLTEDDCRAFTVLDVERKPGDSRKLPSWIWGDFSFVEKTVTVDDVEKFLIGSEPSDKDCPLYCFYSRTPEGLRAHWFRYSALKE